MAKDNEGQAKDIFRHFDQQKIGEVRQNEKKKRQKRKKWNETQQCL